MISAGARRQYEMPLAEEMCIFIIDAPIMIRFQNQFLSKAPNQRCSGYYKAMSRQITMRRAIPFAGTQRNKLGPHM